MHRSTPQSGTWPAFSALTEKRLVHVCTTHAHSNADKSSYAHAQPHTMSKPSNLLTARKTQFAKVKHKSEKVHNNNPTETKNLTKEKWLKLQLSRS